MRALIPLALAALMTLAPATAQDAQPACPDGQVETPEGCSQQAWVDDCPPEQMCAAGSPDEPVQYGEDGCIECSGPVDAPMDGSDAPTCMDGADASEACDDDVQYFGPGPADTDGRGEPASSADKDAPIFSAAILLVVLLGLVALVRRF